MVWFGPIIFFYKCVWANNFFYKCVAQIQGKKFELVINLGFKNLLMGVIIKIVTVEMLYIIKVALDQWRKSGLVSG